MNVCDNGHDEIVYVGKRCPLCQTIEDYELEIKDLKQIIDNLEREE
jgi:hypothetical protein